jgi:hypothetical protein
MLDNLSGSEGIPSPEFVRDLRALCGLGKDDLAKIAGAFEAIPAEPTDESISNALRENTRDLQASPETIVSSLRVAVFLWKQWERRQLGKNDIEADLLSLETPQDQMANMGSLLDAMERKIDALRRERIEANAISIGTPLVDAAACSVDARAVFRSSRHEKDGGDEQPYFQIDRFVPVAILELVSRINDEKDTQAYLLTESTLDQLSDILARAKTRMRLVKAHCLFQGKKGGDDANPNP